MKDRETNVVTGSSHAEVWKQIEAAIARRMKPRPRQSRIRRAVATKESK